MPETKHILVVDDEPAIRMLLKEFLQSLSYDVSDACDGVDALEKLEKRPADLVLSDINMPRMKGFELLKTVREKYPQTKRVLVTAYDVDDYLQLAMEHDIGNIIPKSAPFNFDDVERVVQSLITENIFGLERHLPPGTSITQKSLCDPDEIDQFAIEISDAAQIPTHSGKLKLVLVELLTNAVFYGARNEDGAHKENWERDFRLKDGEAVEVAWGRANDRFSLMIADPFGRLEKREILHWLVRQTVKDDQGLPVGIFDTHGRGLFIARSYVDSLIINIKPGARTEMVGTVFVGRELKGFKPLYINEI